MEDPSVGLDLVEDLLRRRPSAFGFFRAVRLLEELRPERARVGGFADPGQEVVRFAVRPTLAFPASEIHSLTLPEDGPAQMNVEFMGLTGPMGVLPHPYTQLVAERNRSRDRALADFLDIFHHRIISLFYRAWTKQHFSSVAGTTEDRFREHLLDLAGVGLEAMRGRLPIEDDALAYYTGLLGSQARSAVALEQLVAGYFDVPVEVEQFVGAWHPIDRDDQCQLGVDEDPSNQLGFGAIVGDEVWEPQTCVRLRIGPLPRSRYEEFLPEGSAHLALAGLARYFGHDQFQFDVQLVLDQADIPALVLGSDAAAEQPLGWLTWLPSSQIRAHADQTVFPLS